MNINITKAAFKKVISDQSIVLLDREKELRLEIVDIIKADYERKLTEANERYKHDARGGSDVPEVESYFNKLIDDANSGNLVNVSHISKWFYTKAYFELNHDRNGYVERITKLNEYFDLVNKLPTETLNLDDHDLKFLFGKA